MRDHFGEAERGTLMFEVSLNALVATSWKAFASDTAVKSRDTIQLHQERYSANSAISRNAVASGYLTDCHQAHFLQQGTLDF